MPKLTEGEWRRLALRRAKFVLDEAGADDPYCDETVKVALRIISSIASVGGGFASRSVKSRNHRISKAARALLEGKSFDEWHKLTTNEHQEPMSQVWEWIKENADKLKPECVVARLEKYPIVTITREEDRILTKNGHRYLGEPAARFLEAKIEVIIESAPPQILNADYQEFASSGARIDSDPI